MLGRERQTEAGRTGREAQLCALPFPAFVSDEAGRILAVNDLFEKTFGKRGRLDANAFDLPQAGTREGAAWEEAMRTRRVVEMALAGPPGFSCRLVPVPTAEGPMRWLGVCRPAARPSPGSGPSRDSLAVVVAAQREIAAAQGDLDRTFAIVIRAALAAAPSADGAAIELADGRRLVYRAATGLVGNLIDLELPLEGSLSGLCIREARPLISEDCETDARVNVAALRGKGVRSMLVAPVFRRGQAVGVLKLASARPAAFSDSEALLAQLLVGALDLGFADIAEREARDARRASDAALQASEAQFLTTAEMLPGILFVTSAEGKNLFLNEGFAVFSGRPLAELLQDGWFDLVHPDDARRVGEVWGRAVATGTPYEAEYRFRRHDGEWRWHIARALPLRREDGTVERWVGCCIDIHERRQSEEELQRRIAQALAERSLWAEIVESSDAFIQVVDVELRIVAVNRASAREWERLFGVRPRPGLALADVLGHHPAEYEALSALWRRALGGEGVSDVMPLADPARGPRWYEFKINPLHAPDGRLIGAMRFAYDVTERLQESRALAERTEELRLAYARLQAEMRSREEAQAALIQSQKLEALGRLTSGIAHDFNNVTQAVAGGFAVIEARTSDPRVAEIARHGAAAAQRGGRLVKQMLAFARQQALAPRRVDLPAQLRETEPLLARTLGPELALVVECAAGLPPVRLDPTLLETALINLAANARDAMPGGGRMVLNASVSEAGDPGRPAGLGARRAVAVAVSDSGCGMAPEVLQRAVEPFYTTKGPNKGTGLGLAMVHGFVRQSGGELRIESREGEGATVTLYLPCAEPSGEQDEENGGEALSGVAAAGRKILLVDDDDAVRGVTAAQLALHGARVSEANGAKAALAALAAGRFDLVITDVVMDETDGIVLAEAIRARAPGQPILFITGHADRQRLKGELVLDKPFTSAELAQAVAEAIRR